MAHRTAMRQNCGEHSMRSAARSMEGSKRTGDFFFFDFLRTSSVELYVFFGRDCFALG
jgi:hypothetical protein